MYSWFIKAISVEGQLSTCRQACIPVGCVLSAGWPRWMGVCLHCVGGGGGESISWLGKPLSLRQVWTDKHEWNITLPQHPLRALNNLQEGQNVVTLATLPLWTDKMTHIHDWKHYLSSNFMIQVAKIGTQVLNPPSMIPYGSECLKGETVSWKLTSPYM